MSFPFRHVGRLFLKFESGELRFDEGNQPSHRPRVERQFPSRRLNALR